MMKNLILKKLKKGFSTQILIIVLSVIIIVLAFLLFRKALFSQIP